MEITLIIGENKESRELPQSTSIKDMLDREDIPSETVVVKKNNEIVLEDELLEDGDIVEVIKVIYGG
ncbi:MAG: MoaD/ThiS family protein [Euryarchaeota archaeon]|nr:MoaD/ThiS family protein [Euryarchaeota archaeon]